MRGHWPYREFRMGVHKRLSLSWTCYSRVGTHHTRQAARYSLCSGVTEWVGWDGRGQTMLLALTCGQSLTFFSPENEWIIILAILKVETTQSLQWHPTQCLEPGKPLGKVRLSFCHVALMMFKTKRKGYKKGSGSCCCVNTEGEESDPRA